MKTVTFQEKEKKGETNFLGGDTKQMMGCEKISQIQKYASRKK